MKDLIFILVLFIINYIFMRISIHFEFKTNPDLFYALYGDIIDNELKKGIKR